MSAATDYATLSTAIENLYLSGAFPHTTNPEALKIVVAPGSGALGVGTAGAYTSGLVKDSTRFKHTGSHFNSTTPVVAGDVLQVPYGQFLMPLRIAAVVSDIEITLAEPAPVTIAVDLGYTILHKYTGSPFDDIFTALAAVKTDLGV
jgi:hypothetical protein